MKRRTVITWIIITMIFGLFCQNVFAVKEEDADIVEVSREVNLYLFVEDVVTPELIAMYEECGWNYIPDDNSFIRTVVYNNDDINVDGMDIETGDDGSAVLDKSELSDLTEVEIESITGEGSITVNLEDEDNITIQENVSINSVLDGMETLIVSDEDGVEIDGEVQLGQKNGELPKKGDIVACNRFNGYQGNGRYYSKATSKQALKNFKASDCEKALINYPHCLRDSLPASKRYCSLYSKSHYGKCSKLVKNGYSHSTKYHKHTTFSH